MKKTICLLLLALLLLCVGCSRPAEEPTEATTTEPVTVDPALLPEVFEDASAFVDAGQIELFAPDGATEVTQVILFDEICQVQFMFNDVFYTYRAAFASTNRTGYELTGIVEALEYLETTTQYTNESADYAFETHALENGSLLLWSDGNINYSLASRGGTFEDFCGVADMIIK